MMTYKASAAAPVSVLSNNAPRREGWYFEACQNIWYALGWSGMKDKALWRLLSIVHRMGKDFALSFEERKWVHDRLMAIIAP